ncbi:MAG: hypothetical protein ACO3ZW_00460 [Opitutales bacterium]|jgi:hypothetical protein
MLTLASSPFINSLEHIIGFVVVLLALTILWLLTATLGHFYARGQGAEPVLPMDADGPTQEEVAVIAACVASIVGRRSRIVSIRRGRKTDWNREGRREHFSSRRIR